MSSPGVLSLLVLRCHRSIRFYGPATTCVTLYALGQLQPHGLRAPVLLRQLAPSLPSYSPLQLAGLMEGLSLLRVSHLVMTAHVLRLFFLSLQKEEMAMPWVAEVAAVATMVRVLQRHHTPRTVRAFLAAVDRALVARGDEDEDSACVPDTMHRSVRQPSAHAAASSRDRRAALQLLYILEVYINAGIRVAEPHTPRWWLRMLHNAPSDAFAPQSLLHLHGRLLAAESETLSLPCDEQDAPLRAVLAEQSAFVIKSLTLPIQTGAAAERDWTARREGEAASAFSSCAVDEEGKEEKQHWGERLSEVERHAVLRCVVVYHLYHSAKPATLSTAALIEQLMRGYGPAAPPDVYLLLSLSLSFLRLTRQFCWALCGQPWRWWLQVLEASHNFALTACGDACSTIAKAAIQRAATLQSTALLQLLHGCFIRCGAGGVSGGHEDPRSTVNDRLDSIQNTVRLLCSSLAVYSTAASASCSPCGDAEGWTLLALLLSTENLPPQCAGGLCFMQWLEEQLRRRITSECAAAAARLGDQVAHFQHARQKALSFLVDSWCGHWTGDVAHGSPHLSNMLQCRYPDLSRSSLSLHWVIAAALYAYSRHSGKKGGLHGDQWRVFFSLEKGRFSSAWRSLTAATVAVLSSERSELNASPSATSQDSLELKLRLLHVVAMCLHEQQFPSFSSEPLLWDSLARSALPELLCAALERRAAEDDLLWSPASTPEPLQRCQGSKTPPPAEENTEAFVREIHYATAYRSGGSMWWVSPCCTSPHRSSLIQQALRSLLRIGFSIGASMPLARGLLPRLLHYHLQCVPLCSPLPAHDQEAKGDDRDAPAGEEEERQRWQPHSPDQQERVVAAASWQIVDGRVHHTGSSSSSITGRLQTMSEPSAPAWRVFAAETGLAGTMMSNVELFCHRGGRRRCDPLFSTLRDSEDIEDGAARQLSSLPRHSASPLALMAAQQSEWYRDAHRISLTAHARQRRSLLSVTSAVMNSGDEEENAASVDHTGAGRLQRGAESLFSTTPAQFLEDFVERVRMVSAAAAELRMMQKVEKSSVFHCVEEVQIAASSSTPTNEAASAPTRMLVALQHILWRDCRRVLQRLSYAGDDTRNMTGEALRETGKDVEEAVLWCILQRKGVPAHTSHACAPPFVLPAAATCAADSNDGDDALSFVFPYLWLSLHAACFFSAVMPDLLLGVWRLQGFAEKWWTHFPFTVDDAPSQRRLLACLQASLSAALTGRVGGEGEHTRLILQSVNELSAIACIKQGDPRVSSVSQPTSPFQCLSDVLEKVAHAMVQRHSPGGVNCGGDGAWSRGTAIRPAHLSPIEIYLEVLLPFHPFLRCPGNFLQDTLAAAALETQLVAVTWAHVLVIRSICAHHPRIHVRHTCGPQQTIAGLGRAQRPPLPSDLLRSAQHTLSDLEQQLLQGGACIGGAQGGEASAAAARRRLQWRCLAGELKSALAGLSAILAESFPLPSEPL